MKKPETFGISKSEVYEDYGRTFREWCQKDDTHRWIGNGSTMEFPHNEGALEEKIDEEQGRKTFDNWGY